LLLSNTFVVYCQTIFSFDSLDFTLTWYGLIPERVDTVTSITTGRSRIYNTPAGRFSYTCMSEKRFAARTEVFPFISNVRSLDIWSKDFFKAAAQRIVIEEK
jgi:hypothetical protein